MTKRRSQAEWRELLEDAARKGWHAAEVHRRTGHSLVTIRAHLRELGIVLARKNRPLGINWDAEFAKALANDETTASVAHRLGAHKGTVSHAASRRGVQLRLNVAAPRDPAAWAAEFRRAAERGETQSALARRLGVSRQAVSLASKRLPAALQLRPKPSP